MHGGCWPVSAIAFPHLLLCAEPSTLKGRRFGNVIIVGAATPLPYAAIAERAGRVAISVPGAARRTIEPTTGRLVAFTDADAEESPEPGRGLRHFT